MSPLVFTILTTMKRLLNEVAVKKIYATLLEKFGEPIGKAADRGQGVADERGGHSHKGPSMGNRGFGAALDEEEKEGMRTCPSCKGTGRTDSVRQHRTLKMKCPTCKGHGLIPKGPKVNEDLMPGEVNEPTCDQCGAMMPMESTSCNQCGMMAEHLVETYRTVRSGDPENDHGMSYEDWLSRAEAHAKKLFMTMPRSEMVAWYNDAKAAWEANVSPHDYAADSGSMDEAVEKMMDCPRCGHTLYPDRNPKCSQCGYTVKKKQHESEGGGRHPGHASSCTCPDCSRPKEMPTELDEKAPPGREKQVKALKKQKGVKNPFATAWASYNKSH
jgi:ribosomal protein L37E